MKQLLIGMCVLLGTVFASYAQTENRTNPPLSIVSIDTIKEGNATIIKKLYSNGVESKQIFGATTEQLAKYGITTATGLKSGEKSPNFEFTDINGRRVTLNDLQGKYIFIDTWATWCLPCRKEIPYLEELQKQMKGKEITFVSISMDKDRKAWEKMVKEQNLAGVQLYAGEDSEYAKKYNIRSIPRFIILDKTGTIVNAQAVRPSNPDMLEILENLIAGKYTMEQQLEYTTRGLPQKDVTGKQSAGFDYPDINGKQVKLEDLRGKYVLIDIWATWCAPCMQEIPYLQELEEKMHGRNIAFVSISIDEKKAAWEKMVKEKQMGGIQLHFNGNESFLDSYRMNGIPRFILLDREGRIIDDEMKVRPSNPEIHQILNNLEGI